MHGMVRWIHRDRHGFKEEPYEVILHVRICAGDGQQWPFLPRPFFLGVSADPLFVDLEKLMTELNSSGRIPVQQANRGTTC